MNSGPCACWAALYHLGSASSPLTGSGIFASNQPRAVILVLALSEKSEYSEVSYPQFQFSYLRYWGSKPRVLYVPGKHSPTKPQPQLLHFSFTLPGKGKIGTRQSLLTSWGHAVSHFFPGFRSWVTLLLLVPPPQTSLPQTSSHTFKTVTGL